VQAGSGQASRGFGEKLQKGAKLIQNAAKRLKKLQKTGKSCTKRYKTQDAGRKAEFRALGYGDDICGGPALFAEKRGFVSVELLDFEGNVKNPYKKEGVLVIMVLTFNVCIRRSVA